MVEVEARRESVGESMPCEPQEVLEQTPFLGRTRMGSYRGRICRLM